MNFNNEEDTVCVYIITYNRVRLLERAIQSVLNQSILVNEIIIVDDCSSDSTQKYCESLSVKYNNIIYIRNKENIGAPASRNIAIKIASSKFITGLDDDDYFSDTRIKDFLLAWYDKDVSTIAICSKYIYKNKSGLIYQKGNKKIIRKKDLYINNYVGNQIFALRHTFIVTNGFDTSLPAWQDIEYWIRICDLGNIEIIDSWSYIVDISHPHERISTQKLEKIELAYNFIIEKHSLSKKQKTLLLRQLDKYSNYNPYKFVFYAVKFYSPKLLLSVIRDVVNLIIIRK